MTTTYGVVANVQSTIGAQAKVRHCANTDLFGAYAAIAEAMRNSAEPKTSPFDLETVSITIEIHRSAN